MISFRVDKATPEAVHTCFIQWESLREQIHQAHDTRNGQADILMRQAIALFESLIVQCSDTTENTMLGNEQYEVMPLNGVERLQFIQLRPAQYACYRQLDELFKETKKRIASLSIKRTKTRDQ